MKNVSTLKSNKTDSSKTPGGISRSLLSPCPRIGLSRNFRKNGASPFRSPLLTKTNPEQERVETKKRKKSVEETPQTPENDDISSAVVTSQQNPQTPTRKVELPRRKKSKCLLASINKGSKENVSSEDSEIFEESSKSMDTAEFRKQIPRPSNSTEADNTNIDKKEVTPLHVKSKSKTKKKKSPSNSISVEAAADLKKENFAKDMISNTESKENKEESQEKSPNNLTKECIVVLQNNIFKKELKEKLEPNPGSLKTKEISEPVFDSDCDDIPLVCLNKNTKINPAALNTFDDDPDFSTSKPILTKPNKLRLKLKSTTANIRSNSKEIEAEIHKTPQSLHSDNNDYGQKKTILVKKSYDKVIKPYKAKSTGSLSKESIDDLKARIEMKKKMLIARGMTGETKELLDLLKKWKKGCQDALMDLVSLMKTKCSDKPNMDYSEILQTLKIPSSLVGYDSDNECFLTPDDESVILSLV